MAIGARSQSARTYFDKNVDNLDGCSKDELILHALRALRDTLPPDAPPLTGLNTAIGFVGEDTPFSVVEEEEAVQVWLDKLPPPPERPSGAGDSGVGVGVGGDSGAGGGGSGEMQI
jgi:20S proteasome subunit alpha 6